MYVSTREKRAFWGGFVAGFLMPFSWLAAYGLWILA